MTEASPEEFDPDDTAIEPVKRESNPDEFADDDVFVEWIET